MNEEVAADFKRMLFSLTDPEERDKSKRATERLKRRDERIADTGL